MRTAGRGAAESRMGSNFWVLVAIWWAKKAVNKIRNICGGNACASQVENGAVL